MSKASVALDRLVPLDRLIPSISEEHAHNKEPASNKDRASKKEPMNDKECANDKEPASDEEPASEEEHASKNLALLQQDIVETRNETSNIFNFPDLKYIANSLDFNTSKQISRNGNKQVSLHKKRMPEKNIRYRIFDFAFLVTKYSKSSDRLRKKVIKYCATVLFYDHGYKSIKGISRLDRTWQIRMVLMKIGKVKMWMTIKEPKRILI